MAMNRRRSLTRVADPMFKNRSIAARQHRRPVQSSSDSRDACDNEMLSASSICGILRHLSIWLASTGDRDKMMSWMR